MDEGQYDLLLACMTEYELRAYRENIAQAQRLSGHLGYSREAFDNALEASDLELERRREQAIENLSG